MFRYVVIVFIVCLQASVHAQDVANVDALPMQKFLSLLEIEPVTIEAASRVAILKALEPETAATKNSDVQARHRKTEG